MERLARLFVGIGFLWVALVLVWSVLAGFEEPYIWFKWASDSLQWAWLYPTYLALAFFVVPVGMLTFLRDILGDPVALWVKWAAPGAFLAIYALFLVAVLPEVGRPLFLSLESVVGPIAPLASGPGARVPAESVGSWLMRFGVAFAVLAGVPGIIGAIVGMVTGSKAGVRRH
ncbi:MAG TPA: hypothetical protein VGX21_08830 [Methylomirabilota bacterium]|jgi:hypothetical protein|nr:hypothetical protein [Methylomirabilota bacterium]